MSKSVYGELLQIKNFREQSASNEVSHQRRAVEDGEQAVEDAKAEAERYHDWRLEREKQMFEDIRGREVPLEDVQDLRSKAAGMRQEEAHKRDLIVEAIKRLETAQHALEEAHQKHLKAVREVEKFKQLLEAQSELEDREKMRAEDNEIEEIVGAGWHSRGGN